MSAAMGFFLRPQERVRNSFGNEPSVFEPLKFYCTLKGKNLLLELFTLRWMADLYVPNIIMSAVYVPNIIMSAKYNNVS